MRPFSIHITFLILFPLIAMTALAAPQPADLIITRAHIVTMNAAREVIEDGAIIIRDSRIVAIGSSSIAANYSAAKTIDARGDLVFPGLINTHTHASMTVFRGLGDDVPDRLRRFIFPLEKNLIDRELVYWGALHGFVEMIEGGVTTAVDMYYFEDEVARAAKLVGIRGVLGQSILNFPTPDSPVPYGGLAYAKKFAADWANDPLITPALAPHAPYSLDAEHLRLVAKASAELNLPILMHVAEMTDEISTLRRERNQTPVEYLDSLGLLTPRLVAAHCIFVTDSDIALLKARDVGIAHNMVANIKSAKGVAPGLKMHDDGLRIGLGTDGPMSGNTLDLIGQLGYVAKLHKLDRKDRNVMPALKVVEMATLGGARALHREKDLGSLEPGKLADLIILDHNSTALVPLYDVYSTLVYAASPRDVRTTVIHGRVVMEDRKILTLNPQEVREKMRSIARRINTAIAAGIR
ncbi:MAG: amidohydrolase [Verrucomicrobia bacterium]|jgi:5-methylthioadenosine/S-adenosylhomocysteine deaminase|nr:amidohydrolase [Verrucomicrobiota bacterium]